MDGCSKNMTLEAGGVEETVDEKHHEWLDGLIEGS